MDNKAENSLALAVALLPKPDKRRLNGAMGRPHRFFAPTFISDWLDYIITIKFVRKLSRKVQLLAQTAPYYFGGRAPLDAQWCLQISPDPVFSGGTPETG